MPGAETKTRFQSSRQIGKREARRGSLHRHNEASLSPPHLRLQPDLACVGSGGRLAAHARLEAGERPRPAGVPEGEGPPLRLPRQRAHAGPVRSAQAKFAQYFLYSRADGS